MSPTLIIISLILLGILMILIEFLLTPGMGIAGIVGLASFVASAVFAFARCGSQTGTIVTAVVVVIVVVVFVLMLRGKTWKKFEQKEEIDARAGQDATQLKVADKGVTVSRLAPSGNVRFGSLTCEAKSQDNKMLDPGLEVEIVSVSGSEIIVAPISPSKE